MEINKYHLSGNNFLICKYQDNVLYDSLSFLLCNRKNSLGSDGLIVYKDDPFTMEIYNQDGTKGKMCGNGIRILYQYLLDKKLYLKDHISIRTQSSTYLLKQEKEYISLSLPLIEDIKKENLLIGNDIYLGYSLNVGNDHYVLFFQETLYIFLKQRQPCLLKNLNMVKIIDLYHIEIIHYELGVGFTSSCGSGILAVISVLYHLKKIKFPVIIKNQYGDQICYLQDKLLSLLGQPHFIYQVNVDA